MRARYSTSITMSEEDMVLFTKLKEKPIEIFRLGLIAEEKIQKAVNTPMPRTHYNHQEPKKEEPSARPIKIADLPKPTKYGCGCKYTGETLCPKHGRM